MLKTGILSFSVNHYKSAVNLVENEKNCSLIGSASNHKILMIDDHYKHIHSIELLIDCADILVIDSADSNNLDLLKYIIRKSKHIYVINPGKFSHEDTENLLKLSNEAGVIVIFSQPHRVNPLIFEVNDHLLHPTFVNIVEDGVHNGNEAFLFNKLIEKIDYMLMFVNSNIYRITACSSSDEYLNIRMEFNNSVDANITINQLSDENKLWIEIYSPGENIKIDLLKNEVFKINKKGKRSILPTLGNEWFNNIEKLRSVEFGEMISGILDHIDISGNLNTYHYANLLAKDVLKKISYVLT